MVLFQGRFVTVRGISFLSKECFFLSEKLCYKYFLFWDRMLFCLIKATKGGGSNKYFLWGLRILCHLGYQDARKNSSLLLTHSLIYWLQIIWTIQYLAPFLIKMYHGFDSWDLHLQLGNKHDIWILYYTFYLLYFDLETWTYMFFIEKLNLDKIQVTKIVFCEPLRKISKLGQL